MARSQSPLKLSRGSGTVYAKYVCSISHCRISSGITQNNVSFTRGQDLIFILLFPLQPDLNCLEMCVCVCWVQFIHSAKKMDDPSLLLINSAFDYHPCNNTGDHHMSAWVCACFGRGASHAHKRTCTNTTPPSHFPPRLK